MPPQYKDGTLRQRPNGLWEYRFKESPKPVYGRTQQICYDKRTAILKGENETKTGKSNQALTLGEWITTWYDRFRRGKHGEKTQKNTLYQLNQIVSGLGQIQLTKLTTDQIQDFLNKFNDRRNAQDKFKKLLKPCLEKAQKLKYIKSNPFEDVEIANHKYKSYPVIQPADQNRIIEVIKNSKYMRLFFFCCCTGLRISEALSIQASDFDPAAHIINVDGVDTATKRHIRQIHYLPELIDLPASGVLFPDISYRGASQYFRKLFSDLCIKAVVHSFRHTFSSCCNHVGFNGKQIQAYLGHSSIEMTMDTYTHILKNQPSPIIEYLNKLKLLVDTL